MQEQRSENADQRSGIAFSVALGREGRVRGSQRAVVGALRGSVVLVEIAALHDTNAPIPARKRHVGQAHIATREVEQAEEVLLC